MPKEDVSEVVFTAVGWGSVTVRVHFVKECNCTGVTCPNDCVDAAHGNCEVREMAINHHYSWQMGNGNTRLFHKHDEFALL